MTSGSSPTGRTCFRYTVKAEKINSYYVSRVLRLTLLAPDIVEAILDGRQKEGMTVPGLMDPFPVRQGEQREALAGS